MTSTSPVLASSSSPRVPHGSEGETNTTSKPETQTWHVSEKEGVSIKEPTVQPVTEKVSDKIDADTSLAAGPDDHTLTNDMSDFKLTKADLVHFNPKSTLIEDWLDFNDQIKMWHPFVRS